MYVCMYVCIYIYIYVCMYVYIYIYQHYETSVSVSGFAKQKQLKL